jgi:multiple sugar transport system permease protein/sn-glycerol 3-phosphate transport system permease protein
VLRLSLASRVVGHVLTISFCVLIVAPLLLALLMALKSPDEIYSPIPWPSRPTLQNFAQILSGPFLTYLWNSVGTTILRVAGQMALAIPAAYAFARWTFRGRDLLFGLVLAAMMVSHILTMLPIYVLLADLGWLDTWTAIVVPNLAFPVGVFLMRQHMLAFPRALIHAAIVDGAGNWRVLWKVMVPNLLPAIAGLAIVAFIESWNEYFWPLLVTNSDGMATLQIGLHHAADAENIQYGPLMAGVAIASFPALLVFFLLQRLVMSTFLSAGVK